jgi:ribosomal protein S24E
VYKGVQLLDKNNVKEKIKKVLSKHPEGLPIIEIAKLVGMHRHTITKYIYQLVGSGEIYQREVGTARLCYLKKRKRLDK